MSNQLVLGGQTADYKELFHYTDTRIVEVPSNKFFTDYKTDSSSDAKKMTGSTNILNYRITVLVKESLVYELFRDGGTRNGPIGLGMALVYQNKNAIKAAYLKIDQIS